MLKRRFAGIDGLCCFFKQKAGSAWCISPLIVVLIGSALTLGLIRCSKCPPGGPPPPPDVIIANNQQRDRIYKNNGDGTFTDASDLSDYTGQARGIAAGDMDGDGDLDVILVHNPVSPNDMTNGLNRLYKNNGDGTFTEAAPLCRVSPLMIGVYPE